MDRVALGEKTATEIGTDESGSSRDEYSCHIVYVDARCP
jgi:hypothetical protein